MGIYLVMKNNFNRAFARKSAGILMVLLPILLVIIGIVSGSITDKTIRVGVLNPVETVQELLSPMEHVQYEFADSRTVQTDQIMGKYHYVMDANDTESTQRTIAQIQERAAQIGNGNSISTHKRFAAMLLTAYFVIATVYASKLIRDRNQGLIGRARAAGMKTGQYFMGYVLSTGIIVVIQLVIAVTGFAIMEPEFPLNFQQTAGFVGLSSVIVTIYGALYALVCRREMTANLMAASIAVIFSIIGGTFVSIEQMPPVMQSLSMISPVRWILELFF